MPTDFTFFTNNPHLERSAWIASVGAMLVLLQSILSGERRVWWRLLTSCIVGGAAAALAGDMFSDSKWVYAICGVAAIMAENVLFGFVKASKQFRDEPVKVFGDIWRVVVPGGVPTSTAGTTADKDA